MIHGDHHIKVALQSADEQGIGGVRTSDVPTGLLDHLLDGGLDHIHFLAAAQTELTAVRVQSSHGDAGLVAQALTGDLAQLDGLTQVALGDHAADLADGHMARGTDGHQIVHHVDLTEGGLEVKGMGKISVLTLIVHTGHLHSALVEGAKDDALDLTGLAEFNGSIQLLEIAGATVGVGFAVNHLIGILIFQIQNGVALGPVALAQVVDDVMGHVTTHDLQAVLKHPQVTDDHGPAVISVIVLHSQHGHQLRANAGGVAQQDAENGLFTHIKYLHRFPVLQDRYNLQIKFTRITSKKRATLMER